MCEHRVLCVCVCLNCTVCAFTRCGACVCTGCVYRAQCVCGVRCVCGVCVWGAVWVWGTVCMRVRCVCAGCGVCAAGRRVFGVGGLRSNNRHVTVKPAPTLLHGGGERHRRTERRGRGGERERRGKERSEERRVGEECRSRGSPDH